MSFAFPFRLSTLTVSFLLAVVLLPASPHAQSVPVSVLTSGQPVLGSLAANATAYYSFTSSAVPYQQTALLSVAAALGFPSLYVSLSNRQPSAGSFDYFASWQTGGAVSVASQQPPYTLYVAVQASPYSRCNYTLTAEAYDTGTAQSTPIPLYDAQPTSSAIAAGEYRYFAYNVSANASASTATIALTETYGQSWLLLNSPNATQLPTLAQAQYMSASATFPLVALQQPAAGVWTIGVWCNASSAFSIVAVSHTATLPMELGITYPGWAPTGQYVYYSLYLDALLLASNGSSLQLELYSVSGDADLFCSYSTAQPTPRTSPFISSNSAAEDRLSIPNGQLRAGSLYCGVFGYVESTYTFASSYGSVFVSVLTAGETVVAESAAGGSPAVLDGAPRRQLACDAVSSGRRRHDRAVHRRIRPSSHRNKLRLESRRGDGAAAAHRSLDALRLGRHTDHPWQQPAAVPAAGAGAHTRPFHVSHLWPLQAGSLWRSSQACRWKERPAATSRRTSRSWCRATCRTSR